MLKQLRINLLLEKQKRMLADLLGQQEALEQRKADIEKRFEAAAEATDKEIEEIEADLDTLDQDAKEADVEKKIKDDIKSLKNFGPQSATINGQKYTVDRVDSRHLKVIIPKNSGQIGKETVENLKGYAFVQGVILDICEYETSERYTT